MAPPPPRRHHHPIQPSFQDRAEVAAVSKQAIAVSHSAFSKAIAAQRGGGAAVAAAPPPRRHQSEAVVRLPSLQETAKERGFASPLFPTPWCGVVFEERRSIH